MANRVLSIDVGFSITKIVEVDFKQKSSKVYSCFSIPTPQNSVDDGYIKDPEAFGDALRREIVKHGIKTKKAVFTITSTKIANREVAIPQVKPNRISQLVAAKAGEYFPVDVSQYQFTYTILDLVVSDNNKQYKLLVLAAPKDLLETYYKFAEQAGLSIEAIDYSGNSILPVIKAEVTDDVTLIIKVDERATLLTILAKKNIVLQRNVAYGAESAIQSILDHDVFGSDMTYESALELLRGQSVIRKSFDATVQDEDDAVNDDERYRQARVDVTESLSMLIGSITRVIDYYNSRNTEAQISRILLTGFGGDFSGLSKLMTNEIGTKVTVLHKIASVNLDRAVKKDNVSIGEYIACIGAAIDPLDLIPEEHSKKKKKSDAPAGGKKDYSSLGYILLAAGVVISVVLAVLSIMPYMLLKQENASLNEKITQLSPIIETYNTYMDTTALYNEVEKMYGMTANRNDGLRAFMEELEQKLPSDTVVTSFTSDPTTVSLGFTCGSKEDAANIINNLRSFESVAAVSVTTVTEAKDDETGLKADTFTMTCTYKPADTVSSDSAGVSGNTAEGAAQ